MSLQDEQARAERDASALRSILARYVLRMCCGAPLAGNADSVVRCTLAIGDHEQHEDIATGVKWSARPREDFNANLRAAAAGVTVTSGLGNGFIFDGSAKGPRAACPNCGGDDATCRGSLAGLKTCAAKGSGRATMDYMLPKGNGFRVGGEAPREDLYPNRLRPLAEGMNGDAGGLYVPAAIEWRNGSASLGQSQAHVLRDGDVCRWQVNHLGLRIRDGVESHAFDAHAAAGRILFAVHDATAGIEWLAEFFGLLFRVHDSTPAAMRAKQEAPLVALVAAVPAGLDPIGWRAAVLAADETHALCSKERVRWDYEYLAEWLPAVIAEGMDECDASTPYADAFHAYYRAITPAPKVERERATWKTRGPVLPCDNGEDE